MPVQYFVEHASTMLRHSFNRTQKNMFGHNIFPVITCHTYDNHTYQNRCSRTITIQLSTPGMHVEAQLEELTPAFRRNACCRAVFNFIAHNPHLIRNRVEIAARIMCVPVSQVHAASA